MPICRSQFTAEQVTESNACLGDLTPVPPRLLAFGRAEGPEEIIKRSVVVIVPVKLAVLAHVKTGFTQQMQLRWRRKEHVKRRTAGFAGEYDRSIDKSAGSLGVCRVGQQQSRARCRCKGDSRDELGVVRMASLLIRAGPRPVEDELAPTMAFLIKDQCRAKFVIAIANAEVARRPARIGRYGSAFLRS